MRLFTKLVLVAALVAAPGLASATTNLLQKDHTLGVGLGGGAFTSGISAKAFLGETVSAQATVGRWWGYGLAANVDGLLEMPQFFNQFGVGINWYIGAGAGVVLANSPALGVNAVIGASAQLEQFPLELTAEFRPTYFIGGEAWNYFSWSTGGGALRYYF